METTTEGGYSFSVSTGGFGFITTLEKEQSQPQSSPLATDSLILGSLNWTSLNGQQEDTTISVEAAASRRLPEVGSRGPPAKLAALVSGTAYVIDENGLFDSRDCSNRVTRLSSDTVNVITSNRNWPSRNDLRKVIYNDNAIRLSRSEVSDINFRGMPLLENHNSGKKVGNIIHGSIDKNTNEVIITAEITDPTMVHSIKGSRHLPKQSFSIGYDIETDKNWDVTKKKINEVSLVLDPFFQGCHVSVFASKDPPPTPTTHTNDIGSQQQLSQISDNVNKSEDIKETNQEVEVVPDHQSGTMNSNSNSSGQNGIPGGAGTENTNGGNMQQQQQQTPMQQQQAPEGTNLVEIPQQQTHQQQPPKSKVTKRDLLERLEREGKEREELKQLVESRSADLKLLDQQRETQAKQVLAKLTSVGGGGNGEDVEMDDVTRTGQSQLEELFRGIFTNPQLAPSASLLAKTLLNPSSSSSNEGTSGFIGGRAPPGTTSSTVPTGGDQQHQQQQQGLTNRNNYSGGNTGNNNGGGYNNPQQGQQQMQQQHFPQQHQQQSNMRPSEMSNAYQQQQYLSQLQQAQQQNGGGGGGNRGSSGNYNSQQSYGGGEHQQGGSSLGGKRSFDNYSNKSGYVPDVEHGRFGGSATSQLLANVGGQQYNTKRTKSQGYEQQQMYHQHSGNMQTGGNFNQMDRDYRKANPMLNAPEESRMIHLTASASSVLGQALGTYNDRPSSLAGIPMVLPCTNYVEDKIVPWGIENGPAVAGWYTPRQTFTHAFCLDNAMVADPHTLSVTASDEPCSFVDRLNDEQKSWVEDAKSMQYFEGKSDEALYVMALAAGQKKSIKFAHYGVAV